MKSMLDFIEEANNLLGSVWGDAGAHEIRTYLNDQLSGWTVEEREDLLTLAATFAFWNAEGARDALHEIERRGREIETAASKTSKGLRRFRLRESDKRETARRASVIEMHFGAALRGGIQDSTDEGATA